MKPGIHDLPMADYLALPAFSASVAHAIESRSPLHAFTDSPLNPNRERDDSKEADLGVYAHAVLLEGGHGALEIVEGENWTKKCFHNGTEAAAWKHREDIRARGKLPILAHQVAEVDAMCAEARRFLADSELSGVLDAGEPERTLICDLDGTTCKARPDWMNAKMQVLLHYKTTENAEPGAWHRGQLVKQGYDLAAVHYEEVANGATGRSGLWRSIFLVQEVSAPYSCQLTALDPALHAITLAKWQRALRIWKECVAADRWPGYSSEIHYAEPAAWQIAEVEERDAREAYDQLQAKEGIQA